VAGSVAHFVSVLGARSIDCSSPESGCQGETINTHFEEHGRFASDCDIEYSFLKFTAPRLFVARPSRMMLIFSTEPRASNHHKKEILISRSSTPWPAAAVSAIDDRYLGGLVR
jgi:hypothetical protein